MDPNAIKEWAGALAPYVAFFAAFWAIHTYRRAKKVEVARLQNQIFDDLYLSGKFDGVREMLDFDYAERVEPVLVRVLDRSDAPVPKEDRALLLNLDSFLNLFEFVLYLEQDKKLLTSEDRNALLGYWTGWMGEPRHQRLRDYLREFDYEKLTKCLDARETA